MIKQTSQKARIASIPASSKMGVIALLVIFVVLAGLSYYFWEGSFWTRPIMIILGLVAVIAGSYFYYLQQKD